MALTPTVQGNSAWAPGVSADIFVPDQLIAGDLKIVTKTITLLTGTAYKRGHVLGKITASGKYTVALSASSDGSQTPAAICVDDVDATGGDASGGIYQMGEFNETAVILGTGITLAAARTALEAQNIYLKPVVPATDPS